MSAFSFGQLIGYALWAILICAVIREVVRRVRS